MFQLLNPIFLWAGITVAIPLILHLMQRRRIVRIPFSTIRFLKLAEKKSSSRIHMEHFILWLLRTLLTIVITLAFAMPMLRTKYFGRFLGRAQRDIAIVLDTSYSMGYNTGRATTWDTALDCAATIVQGLEDGDNLCVYLADDDVTPLIEGLIPDRDAAVAQIKALKVNTTTSQLAPALAQAYAALTEEKRRREREVHIISDGQALPWTSFRGQRSEVRDQTTEVKEASAGPKTNDTQETTDNGLPAEALAEEGQRTTDRISSIEIWDPEKVDKRTAFFVTLTGATSPQNVAPLKAELEPALIMSDMPCKVKAEFGHSGAARNSTVNLYVDDEDMGNRSILFEGENTENVTFVLPPLKPGKHSVNIQTAVDNLPIDDNFYFLVNAREKLPTLCVGTEDDSFFLMKALLASITGTSAINVKPINVDKLEQERLSDYSCVFLCNALPFPGQTIFKLEQYVQAGGVLVVFPGDKATISDYQTLNCLPGIPTQIADIPITARQNILRWEKPQHPLLRTLKLEPGTAPIVVVRRQLIWNNLEPNTEVLVTAGTENPFLLSRLVGKGHVLLFSVSADRSWGIFPLSPYYLPLVHQIVLFGAGVSSARPYLWTTRSLPLSDILPDITESASLFNPDKESVPIHEFISDNKTFFSAENLLKPGIYTVTDKDITTPTPVLAINVNRSESNLTPLKQENIPELLGVKHVNVANSKNELLRQIKDHRIGKTLGETLLWLAFILACVEVCYANMLSKETAKLSETLRIDASGKTKGG